MSAIDAEDLCVSWIRDHVIRLGLCPYAATPMTQEKIRYYVSDAKTDEELLDDFFVEGKLLLDTPNDELATTMLIAPHYPGSIDEFSELYTWLVTLLESGDEPLLNNCVQPAFFHPAWSFEGLPPESAIHFEKRAPLPIINLLRRSDLDDVVRQGLANGRIVNKEIAEHNAAALETEGYETLLAFFKKHLDASHVLTVGNGPTQS